MRLFYRALQKQDLFFTALAIQAMKWRGFSKHPIHPKHLFDPQRASLLQETLRSMRPGFTFLDIGAGVGTECLRACESGAARAVGIERDPKNIERARGRAEERRVPVEIVDLDLETARFPFDEDTFDLVNFTNVLEHLNNRVAVLKEIKRIKKPEAPVVISVPNADSTWKKRLRAAGLDSRDDEDHKTEYFPEQIRTEIENAGLKIATQLLPVIPSFAWNGLFAFSAAISPAVYRRLQQWKYCYASKKPDEAMGWFFLAK